MIEPALLEAVLAQPSDDAPRLAYADWLEERGDPRGEFIRVQCELARSLPPFKPWPFDDRMGEELRRVRDLQEREARLLHTHGPSWSAPFHELTAGVGFRRGFVESVTLPCEVVPSRIASMRRLAPVSAVTFTGHPAQLGPALDSPHIAGLQAIAFDMYLGHVGAEALSRPRQLQSIVALDLTGCGIEAAGLTALAASPTLAKLRIVILSQNPGISAGGLKILSPNSNWKHLEWLEVADCTIGHDDAQPLVAWPGLARLSVLNLLGNPVGGCRLEEIVESPYFPSHILLEIKERRLRSLLSRRAAAGTNRGSAIINRWLSNLKKSALPWGVSPSWRKR